MLFNKPSSLNGETLLAELNSKGISVTQVIDNGDETLELDVEQKDSAKVQEILANHDGKDTVPQQVKLKTSAINKLIDLGLTEEEAKAFLG